MKIGPQTARLNRLGNLCIGAPVPRFRHGHPKGRDEYRIIALHVIQEEGKRILFALHCYQRSLCVRKGVGAVHGQLDPAGVPASERPAGGDTTLPDSGDHPASHHDVSLGPAILPDNRNRTRFLQGSAGTNVDREGHKNAGENAREKRPT